MAQMEAPAGAGAPAWIAAAMGGKVAMLLGRQREKAEKAVLVVRAGCPATKAKTARVASHNCLYQGPSLKRGEPPSKTP